MSEEKRGEVECVGGGLDTDNVGGLGMTFVSTANSLDTMRGSALTKEFVIIVAKQGTLLPTVHPTPSAIAASSPGTWQ